MKRSILCRQCQLTYPLKQYDGEWGKRINGIAIINYICDLCGKEISAGDQCCCESLGTNNHEYFEWESEFIELI